MKVGDIQGTSPKKSYLRKTSYDSFNYADITKAKFISQRSVNPLEPSYTIRDDEGNVISTGQIAGSAPKPPLSRKNAESHSSLLVKDIHGAQASTKAIGNFTFYKRKDDPKKITNTQDIPGAQVGTLKNCPQTDRKTNPLQPFYDLPGEKECKNEFGGPTSSMDPKFMA